jgi:hypothetical protein
MGTSTRRARRARATSKPKRDFNQIGQLARKARGLATQHQAKIGNRLDPTFLASFDNDVIELSTVVPAAMASRDGQIQLTAAQTTALATGYQIVKAIRETVKSHEPEKDVLLAYGVGSRTNKLLVNEVKTALQRIFDRITSNPPEAKTFSIVAEDIAAIEQAIQAIDAADQVQEAARAAAPLSTQQRNATARRVLSGIKKIAGAGMRACVDDPTGFISFEALVTRKAA